MPRSFWTWHKLQSKNLLRVVLLGLRLASKSE
jgi:hypothetical protein